MRAFNAGVNAVGYIKEDKKYGMVCSWAQMIDYDKISLLLGEQSDTGNNIEIGDVIGVSSLAKGQEEIAFKLGENHSLSTDKYESVPFEFNTSSILITGAKVKMVCKVIDIINKEYLGNDNFIVLQIISKEINDELTFLNLDFAD